MTATISRLACPLDCSESCAILASVEDGIIKEIRGDKSHPLCNGIICGKGKQLLERHYHPDRIKSPLKKMNGKWINISYDDALSEIAENLIKIKNEYGSQAVLHYYDYGYCGLSRTIDKIFFNYYGGSTVHRGGLCNEAGLKAQEYDMGDSQGHNYKDMLNSNTIIIWGRNPADTAVHFTRYLSKAYKQGIKIYLIDPVKTSTSRFASEYIRINPGTDGALALGMARVILKEGLQDENFLNRYASGYEQFFDYVDRFSPEYVETITGIDRDKIAELALAYAQGKPSSIYMGYGMQRYANGGNNVRCIDALGAITGNIGIAGGGVSYANRGMADDIGCETVKSEKLVKNRRSFIKAQFADFVLNADEPPIKMLFINRANPLVQLPNTTKNIQAFQKINFIVTVDMFMTDTARYSDIVIPARSVFEQDDFMYAAFYLNYSQKTLEPENHILGEYELFQALAQLTGLRDFPIVSRDEYLKGELSPLISKFNLDYSHLKEKPFILENRDIAWANRSFKTASGKYEFYSTRAINDGISPLPEYIPSKSKDNEYNLRLITSHYRESMHSQAFAFIDEKPLAYINSMTAIKNQIKADELQRLASGNGEIEVRIMLNEKVPDDTILIYQGWWHKSGSVNTLIDSSVSDMGELACYFECFCKKV